MATAFVQSKNAFNAPGLNATASVTLTTNVVVGNNIVVFSTWGNSADAASYSDNLGNTYTVIQTVSDVTNNQSASIAWARVTTGGSCTVTSTLPNARDFFAILAHEISGVVSATPVDGNAGQVQAAPGTGANGVSSTSFTPTTNGDYIFGATVDDAGADETLTAGTGYTARETPAFTNSIKIMSEDQIQATAAAIAATFTTSVDQAHITLGAAFKPAAATGKTPYQPWYFRAPVMAQ